MTIPGITQESGLSYYISETCNDIDVCFHAAAIDQDIRTFLHIDPCEHLIEVGIEEFKFRVIFNDFEWGKYVYCAVAVCLMYA